MQIIQVGLKMKFFYILAFFTFWVLPAQAEHKLCSHLENKIVNYKKVILGKDYNILAKDINFPIKGQLSNGTTISINTGRAFDKLAKYIFTQGYIDFINTANNCEIAKSFGLLNEEQRITSLIYLFDDEDLKYSKSGISSEKKLNKFIELMFNLVEKRDVIELSKHFYYPFYFLLDNKQIKISNSNDFLLNEQYIITNKFSVLIGDIYTTRKFYTNLDGMKLDKTGNYWIIEKDNKLFIQAINPE